MTASLLLKQLYLRKMNKMSAWPWHLDWTQQYCGQAAHLSVEAVFVYSDFVQQVKIILAVEKTGSLSWATLSKFLRLMHEERVLNLFCQRDLKLFVLLEQTRNIDPAIVRQEFVNPEWALERWSRLVDLSLTLCISCLLWHVCISSLDQSANDGHYGRSQRMRLASQMGHKKAHMLRYSLWQPTDNKNKTCRCTCLVMRNIKW